MIFDEIIKQLMEIIHELKESDDFLKDYIASQAAEEEEEEEEIEEEEKVSLKDIIAGKLEQ